MTPNHHPALLLVLLSFPLLVIVDFSPANSHSASDPCQRKLRLDPALPCLALHVVSCWRRLLAANQLHKTLGEQRLKAGSDSASRDQTEWLGVVGKAGIQPPGLAWKSA